MEVALNRKEHYGLQKIKARTEKNEIFGFLRGSHSKCRSDSKRLSVSRVEQCILIIVNDGQQKHYWDYLPWNCAFVKIRPKLI